MLNSKHKLLPSNQGIQTPIKQLDRTSGSPSEMPRRTSVLKWSPVTTALTLKRHVEWITLHHRVQTKKRGHFSVYRITPGPVQSLFIPCQCRQHSARQESTCGQESCSADPLQETVHQEGQPSPGTPTGWHPRPGSSAPPFRTTADPPQLAHKPNVATGDTMALVTHTMLTQLCKGNMYVRILFINALSTRAKLQGCVLSPLLYSLLTFRLAVVSILGLISLEARPTLAFFIIRMQKRVLEIIL